MTLSRFACETVSFLTVIALARLLTPAEVGTAVLAMIVPALANSLILGSFGSPLVRERDLTEAHIEMATVLSLISGLLLAGLVCLAALGLAQILSPDYAYNVALASPSVLFASIFAVPQALRSRRFAFKTLMFVEVTSTVLGSTCSVVLAVLGVGSAAMVLGAVTLTAVEAVLSPIGVGWIRPRWHPDVARGLLRFGLPASMSSLLFIGLRNIDYALISGRLTSAQVGLYFRAYTLAVDYQSKISIILVRVLFPVLSRATDPATFRMARSRMIRAHTVALFPLLAMLAVTAPKVVPLLYGHQWTGAIVPTQILVGAGLTAAIGTGIGPMMLAVGKPRALLYNNLVSLPCFALTVYICAGYGLIATCIGVVVYRILALIIGQYFLATRILGIPLRETLIIDPFPAAISASALLIVALPVTRLMEPFPAPVNVAITMATGFTAYGLALRIGFVDAWSDITRLGRRLLGRSVKRADVEHKLGPAH
jgi:O-antigen/teichoic acid export membrane protein